VLGPARLAQRFHPGFQDHFRDKRHELGQHRGVGRSRDGLMEEFVTMGAAVAVADLPGHNVQGLVDRLQVIVRAAGRGERSQFNLEGAARLHDLRQPAPVLTQSFDDGGNAGAARKDRTCAVLQEGGLAGEIARSLHELIGL
jgi:hypothetical protein